MQNTSQPPVKMDALHLGVLIKLLHSPDVQERDVAVRALKELSPEKITVFLKDPNLSPEAIEYFARHAGQRRDWIQALLSNPSLTEEDRVLLVASEAVLPDKDEENSEEWC